MKRLTLLLPILFEAISEGLYLHGDKVWSKQIQVLLIASWFLIAYVYANETHFSNVSRLRILGKYILLYILFRVILFNYVHNLAAFSTIQDKLELLNLSANWYDVLGYVGTVSIIDRIVAVASFGQWWMIGLFQVICLGLVYGIVKNKI